MATKKMTPLEILKNAPSAKRVLLYGPPGTGKNHLALDLAEFMGSEIYSVTINTETSPLQLLGFWGLKGGETTFIPGPATRALEEGSILLLNEISDTPQAIETLLMNLLDDQEKILAVPIPDGRILKAKAGYRVIATMNGSPDVLREALLNRFDLVILVDRPSDQAIEGMFRDNQPLQSYAKNWFSHNAPSSDTCTYPRPISTRTLLTYERLRSELGRETTANLIFGPKIAKDFTNSLTLLASELAKKESGNA